LQPMHLYRALKPGTRHRVYCIAVLLVGIQKIAQFVLL
jgi:hypothetical protein